LNFREYFRSGVETDGVKEKAGLIPPVPGGVGLTIAMLMMNTAKAAKPAARIRSYGG
jgi:5,10-methylene-tetrahydrofolate dehydrogenase/methenyl tetrahydrofolate cyclohydrolase